MIITRGIVRIAVFSLIAISLGLVYRAEAGDILKVGYVDIGAVIDRYAKTEELEKALEKEQQTKQKEIAKLAKVIEKLERELKTKAPGLKEKERKRRAEIIEGKKEGWRRLFREYDLEIKSKVYEQQRGLIKEIQEAVHSYGKEKGYTFILDSRQVIYGLKGLDVTKEIVKLLNKKEKPSN